MQRAAIYARFSTDLQNERSIDDQVALCRAYCAREGLTPTAVYADKARSGASIFGRDGLIDLMAQGKARRFDVVVVEALDRLSRDMEDLAGIHKRLSFAGVELRAVHDGKADTVMVGLRGLVGQLFREDGAKKVRRGMMGVVRSGRHAGGRAYGYRPCPGARGELKIVEAEATIVRQSSLNTRPGDRRAPLPAISTATELPRLEAENGTPQRSTAMLSAATVLSSTNSMRDKSSGTRFGWSRTPTRVAVCRVPTRWRTAKA